jgi:hypothetical protein
VIILFTQKHLFIRKKKQPPAGPRPKKTACLQAVLRVLIWERYRFASRVSSALFRELLIIQAVHFRLFLFELLGVAFAVDRIQIFIEGLTENGRPKAVRFRLAKILQ